MVSMGREDKKLTIGCKCDLEVKSPVRMPTSHIGVPGFKGWLHSQFQSPAYADSGRYQVAAQVGRCLPSIWVTQMDFWAPGFNFIQTQPL